MQLNFIGLLILLSICLFIGIVIVAVGIGAVATPLQGISGPIVCGGGQLELVTQEYSYKPGQVGYTINWYCVDPAGDRQDRTYLVILASGVIYSLVLFAGLIVWALVTPGKALRRKSA